MEQAGARATIELPPMKNFVNTDAIVLPGVGAFASAINNLEPALEELKQELLQGKPLLGICLGLQLLFTTSQEGKQKNGLNLFAGEVVKLPETVKSPQMGWNAITIKRASPLLDGVPNHAYFYFVHSYVARPKDEKLAVATTDYGWSFPSVVAGDNLYATQFHPEKSGKTGSIILQNFVKNIKR